MHGGRWGAPERVIPQALYKVKVVIETVPQRTHNLHVMLPVHVSMKIDL